MVYPHGLARRTASATTLALAFTLTVTMISAPPAVAEPDAPTERDVQRSKETVKERAEAVEEIEAKLADARGRLQALAAEADQLVQRYYRQQVQLERKRQEYRSAKQRQEQAQQRVRLAKDEVGALAAEQYRTSGGAPSVGELFDADGPRELMSRLHSLRVASRERAATLDEMRAAEIVAEVLRQQTEKALADQRAATRQVREAKAAAEAAAEKQRTEVRHIQRLQASRKEGLAAARARAQRLEQKRGEYLQQRRREQRAAREQALQEAREAREAARTAARQATAEVAAMTGVSRCADKPVSLDGYANGLIPPRALCPLPQNGHLLRADAAAAFIRLNHAYEDAFGEPICVTDSYRTLAVQQRLHQVKPELAAYPGTSNHGRGAAVDLCGGINDYSTSTHQWMRAHAPRYGWVLPEWASADGSMPEPWHWEYAR